jgi:glycosyltransferase involved in cell wall biosynthesis
MTFAFFDDYPNEDLGHHPELVVGLAQAAAALQAAPVTRIYCPPSFVAGRRIPRGTEHLACEGPLPYTFDASRDNLRQACRDAKSHGASVLVNLFLDENYRSFPLPEKSLRLVHVLHRPGPYPRGWQSSRINLAGLLGGSGNDLVVVHTRHGEELAREILPRRNVVRIGWPTTTRAEVARRFSPARGRMDAEPFVLLIGGARDDKGAHCLLRALEGGPLLRIVGEQPPGVEETLRASYPCARVEWETGWVTRARIGKLIEEAAAIVFPYEAKFATHGGASGALAQALSHAKPIILSSVLEDQAPASEACQVVQPGDEKQLRRAIEWVLARSETLHAAALERKEYVLREHTYEGHIDRILDRL